MPQRKRRNSDLLAWKVKYLKLKFKKKMCNDRCTQGAIGIKGDFLPSLGGR